MEREYIQLPPLPADIDAETLRVIWEYLKLSDEEQKQVFEDMRELLGERKSTFKFLKNCRGADKEKIEDFVEALRNLIRFIMWQASDIAAWVCVRKYMDGYTLEQMIEEQPDAKDFIFVMDTMFNRNYGKPGDDEIEEGTDN